MIGMVGWMGRLGLVVVTAACAKDDADGGASSHRSTSMGTHATSMDGGSTAMASSESLDGTVGSSIDQTSAAPDAGDTGNDEETSSGLLTCPGTGYCVSPEANVIIRDNHEQPHTITIPQEHVIACEEREYDIQGEADHSHTVTLLPSHFGKIDIGGQILVTSSETNGHTHVVWSDCE